MGPPMDEAPVRIVQLFGVGLGRAGFISFDSAILTLRRLSRRRAPERNCSLLR
jgi:hypothetical protein